MPIYQYRCDSCNKYSEALRKMSDPPLTVCPLCQAEGLVKVIAPVGIIFKGSGFHKNDYSSTGATSSTKSSSSSDSKSESGSTGESAPATTSESSTKTESKAESKSDSAGSSDKSSGGSSDKVA
jgi:putative FmdB family regulatory protein